MHSYFWKNKPNKYCDERISSNKINGWKEVNMQSTEYGIR
jgi:hypothetical protein